MSNDLNQCNFIGRLGKDPELKYMQNGNAVANFSIAVGSSWKDKQTGDKQERTEWINITAFGKLGEICGEYLKKGSQVFIKGRFKTDKYEKDGITRYSSKIIADELQMLGGKREGSSNQSQPAQQQSQQSRPAPVDDDWEEDIPF